jgi:hypothetical protein
VRVRQGGVWRVVGVKVWVAGVVWRGVGGGVSVEGGGLLLVDSNEYYRLRCIWDLIG